MLAALTCAFVATALLASAPAQPRISVYVGPETRDGFVDADKGVLDSVRDLKAELGKTKRLAVAKDEASATLRLYVVRRGKAKSGDSVETSQANANSVAGTAQGTGTTVKAQSELSRVETLLRVGTYERGFVGESDWVVSGWKRCAGAIVKDLAAWVDANRERIP